MTRSYLIKPDVAGCLGSNTKGDMAARPVVVSEVEYEFDDWLGDDVVSSLGVWMGTKPLMDALISINATGITFRHATTIKSEEFHDMNPDGLELPEFIWFDITGRPSIDDFGHSLHDSFAIVVSERAMEVLKRFNLAHAEMSEYQPEAVS